MYLTLYAYFVGLLKITLLYGLCSF